MRLLEIGNGNFVRVVGFDGGHHMQHKLRQLGILPGDCIRVVRQAPFGGPFLLEVGGREIALGRRIAARILVEETECVSS